MTDSVQWREADRNLRYLWLHLIIDEKSMVGRRMLALIDIRLRQAFPEYTNEPFGGRSIIMFGDFGQLPPVLDFPMYASSTSRDTVSNGGIAAYKHFGEVYKLDVVQRQSGNSEEQQGFRELLLRLREGDCTLSDWEKLSSRFEDNLNRIERDRFSDAINILTEVVKPKEPIPMRRWDSKLNCYWQRVPASC